MGPSEVADLSAAGQINPQMLEHILGPDAFGLTPATFAAKVSGGSWVPARHLLHIAAQIAYAIAKGNARIIVSMPPRHGKSELLSVWTVVWALHNWPMKQILTLSYGADLAEEFSQKARDIILDDFHEEGAHLINPEAKVRADSARVNRFLTEAGGGVRAAGIGGAVYGRGADLLFLDDYYKNVEEARSEVKRQAVLHWFTTIAMSRLHTNGSVIILATRWDQKDLSAELLKLTGSRWTEINLPAEALYPHEFPKDQPDYKDPLGRAPGEPLWPEFFNKDRLQELRETMGSFQYAATYQQNPRKLDSDIFKREWIKIVNQLPHRSRLRFLRSWDLAGTDGGGDWTCGLKVALDTETNIMYLIDMIRVQKTPGQVKKLVEDTADADGIECAVVIEQEPGSSGKALAEEYQQLLAKYATHTTRHTGDKFTRLEPFLAAAEFGRICMLQAEWNEDYLDELASFPSDEAGNHDDQVDVTSQAYNHLFKKVARAGAWGRDKTDVATTSTVRKTVSVGGAQIITGVSWGR